MNLKITSQLFALLLIGLQRQHTRAINIQSRSVWTKKSTLGIPQMPGPAQYVIIHHTVTSLCSQARQCQQEMRNIQAGHMRRRFRDIGYNFVVAGDGAIYEGLGFTLQGQHAPHYNFRSIGIAFMGNYNALLPSGIMMQKARTLIDFGVRTGRIRPNYMLIGHRQTKSTACPGQRLFDEIKKWPRWSPRA